MSKKETSGSAHGQDVPRNGNKASRQDTWDVPEFDELDAPKRSADEACESGFSKTMNDSKRANPSSANEVADHGGVDCKRRRSFCNFHYRTTQGGSSNVEPGDDPAMQSPGTSTKAVKLLEFDHNEEASQLEIPQMDK